MKPRLFDLGSVQRARSTSQALVCLPPGCPCCGDELVETTTWQPALFIGCDYGAATATTVRTCQGCGWWIATGHAAVNPRAFA